ncbi:heme exporter protein CcmD [Massilia hydrophila]
MHRARTRVRRRLDAQLGETHLMNWNSLQEFVSMGGHGAFVWGACLVSFAALACETWLVHRRMRRAALAIDRRGEDQ